ncbi:phytanoyl-CoA dioxygenase family protein [Nitzschia inconspicua]|uniref:Phytanoyl-CoA dioxygenase family protein n=1 Tax=Nitzschia inconspicua TaxID=303405 RepID=A0A9K3L8X7_9STRA|nr:phytanoyl-CoA dioxygenase family protein [Nitzschia inconspicua]KAG7356506.1 phytanoyl-CoA dioxygenase family protein [Nitzschia inconspicua]
MATRNYSSLHTVSAPMAACCLVASVMLLALTTLSAPVTAFVPAATTKNPITTGVASKTTATTTTRLFQSTRTATPIGEVISAVGAGIDEEEFQPKKEKILKEPALWEYNFGLQDPVLTLPHGIVKDVSAPERFEVSEEQIQTLERDGVLHLKGVFDQEWVDYLRKATAYQVDEPHFWAFAGTASKLYDYIQRNVWQTNSAFARFYYHSAMGHVLAQCGRTDEIRVSTDLLMVNPNKGFKWHQDNQNGPISWEEGLRFWITMDETPKDYGAPVYLKGSHKNNVVDDQAVFVDIEQEGLEDYKDQLLEFRTMPGDMLIWHPRTIHKVDGPVDGIWTSYRRVLGGTVAKGGAIYHDKRGSGGVLSDLGRHGLQDGDKLKSSFFPVVYPQFDKQEAAERDSGKVGRNPVDIVTKIGGLATKASGERFNSFFQVLGSRS